MNPDPKNVPLAVIGVAAVFPKAKTLREYWANVKNKVDAIRDVPPSHWNPEDYFDKDPKKPDHVYSYKGGFLEPYDFDPSEFGMAPNNLEATDPAQLFGLVAAKMVLADAGYPVDKAWDRSRVSTILGVTGALELVVPLGARLGHPRWRKALLDAGVPKDVADDVVARVSDSYVGWQENSFPGLLGNVVAGRIANRFDLGGTNCVVDAACGSSLSAAHLACLELQAGRADMVLTGGVDTFNDIFMFTCFTKTPALSPGGHAKPFDAKADGTTLGEGIGMVALKRLTDAEKAGDRIYAVIRGIGTSSDGRGKSIYAPSVGGQTRALKDAYRVAGVSPDTIELVVAHGTGTTVGDGIEVEALTQVYRETGKSGTWVALGSVKSQIGHTKAAAGSAALVKTVMALHHKVMPPTIKVSEPLPILAQGQSPFYLSLDKRPWLPPAGHPRRAACSALGFGGTNFHAVLEEYNPQKSVVDWEADIELIALSGRDTDEVVSKLKPFMNLKSWDELRSASMNSRAAFSAQSSCRLVVVALKSADFSTLIAKSVSLLAQNGGKPSWSSPEGIYFGSGTPGKLGLLFPGQGAQYVGMGRDLVCQFPQAFSALENADAAFSSERRLSDFIFPHPAWTAEQRDIQEKALRSTDVAQPALGAISLGMLRVIESFAIKPQALAGHSYGELVALHAAGRYDEATLHRLSRLRGRLMAAGKGDLGAMLAVSAPLAEVEKVLGDQHLNLVVANRNAPAQNVLSGATSEIEKAQAVFSEFGLKSTRLPVAAAFHSPLVSAATAGLADALKDVSFSKSSLAVYANTTGQEYPDAAAKARGLLAEQLARPVEFVKMIEAMHGDGVRTYLEVGAGARLTSLVGLILAAKDFTAMAVDSSGGRKSGAEDLARVLAQLATLGHPIDLTSWQGGEAGLRDARPKPKMSVTLTGAPFRSTLPQPPPAKLAAAISSVPADPSLLSQALASAQASIDALNQIQQQTAALHLQFLQGQDYAQRSIQALIEQQQALGAKLKGVGLTASIHQAQPVVVFPAATAPLRFAEPVKPAAVGHDVMAALLAVVAEKTGYPVNTIDPQMDLEADLGIDSIKRVEILSAIQEKLPLAPKIKPEHLGTLRTLRTIADYLDQGTPRVVTATPTPSTPSTAEIVPIFATLVAMVAEKTGYPAETIGADMDLEADLGIDSIKRVEILSAVQERIPHAPKVKPEHLGTLRTLQSIADYMTEGMPTPSAPVVSAALTLAAKSDAMTVLMAVVAEKTGYPAETIGADMDLEADLGIDSIKRVEILSAVAGHLPGSPKIKPEHLASLRTLRSLSEYLSAGASSPAIVAAPLPATKEEEPSANIRRLIPELVPVGPRDAFVYDASRTIAITRDSGLDQALARELRAKGLPIEIVSIDDPQSLPGKLGGLILVAPMRPASSGCPWSEESEVWLKKAFLMTQSAGRIIAAGDGRGLIASVTRLDGALGAEGREQDPAFGGVAGLMKTAAREWAHAACRAIDVDPALPLDEAAKILTKELSYEGPVEVGVTAAGVKIFELVELQRSGEIRSALKNGDVVIVTGGARGVTAAAALAVANEFKVRLVLVGRSVLRAEPESLKNARSAADLRREIAARERGLSPKEIGAKAAEIMAGREIRETLTRIGEMGAQASYRSVDVRDAVAVAALIAETEAEFGPVRGLIHGAGVLADKLIVEKTAAQVDAVLDTKLVGLRTFLNVLKRGQLRALALFSSSTARYGRVGQADYAVANEVMNKAAYLLAKRWPDCRVVALGWGPWDGGMVTPALKKMFAAEGVGVIGLSSGGDHLVAELREPGVAEAIFIAGPFERSEVLSVVFVRELTFESHEFLKSHVLNGRAILPFAVSADWMAQAAAHAHPGLTFAGFDDLRVAKAIEIFGATAAKITIHAGEMDKGGGALSVPVEIRDERGARCVFGRAIFAAQREAAPPPQPEFSGPKYPRAIEAVYRDVLFHGPHMRFLRAVAVCGPQGVIVDAISASMPLAWMHTPLRDRWIVDPALLDAAFQALIVWSDDQMGMPCLPSFARHYRQYAQFPAAGLRIAARVSHHDEGLIRADVDFLDGGGALVARLQGFEAIASAGLKKAFRHNSTDSAALVES